MARLHPLQLISSLLVLFSCASAQGAEPNGTPIDRIEDNSFLIEEAYNQEPGVIQHIFTAVYSKDSQRRGWEFNFTQEWPVSSQDHQFSYSIPSFHAREEGQDLRGIADILLNYRFQALYEDERVPAFAPRFSLILPSGSRRKGTGDGVVGYQWNLPFSKKVPPRLAFHANIGLTYLPGVRAPLDAGGLSSRRSLLSPSLGASALFALTPRVHAMLEWIGDFEESIDGAGKKQRDFVAAISPGFRAAVIDKEELQTVVGVALPVGVTRPAANFGVLLYLSIEHKLF
ncbi:MAG: transporter [Candidatus Binatia bacterium]